MRKTNTKARSSTKWTESKGRWIFAIFTFVVASVIFVLFFFNQPPDFYLSAKISNTPNDYSRIIILATSVDLPLSDTEWGDFVAFTEEIGKYNHSPTVFVSLSESSADTELDLQKLSGFTGLDFAILSPAGIDFLNLPYQEQEDRMWQYKESLALLNPEGFMTQSGGATYDSLLAAENAQLSYFSGTAGSGDPLHPDSVLGGKMNLLFFPMSDPSKLSLLQEVWTIFIPPSKNSIIALDEVLTNSSMKIMSMSQAANWIREKDVMGVEISSDLKELVSTVRITRRVKNASLLLQSSLEVVNVTVGNTSLDYSIVNNEVRIPLTNSSVFQVQWANPD